MAAKAGYIAAIKLGPTTYVSITGVKSAELTIGQDIYDITDMNGSPWKKKLGGLTEYSIKISGNFDLSDAKQTALQAAILTNPGATVSWNLSPDTGGASVYGGTALIKTMGIKFNVSSEEQVSWDLDGTGALTYS